MRAARVMRSRRRHMPKFLAEGQFLNAIGLTATLALHDRHTQDVDSQPAAASAHEPPYQRQAADYFRARDDDAAGMRAGAAKAFKLATRDSRARFRRDDTFFLALVYISATEHARPVAEPLTRVALADFI